MRKIVTMMLLMVAAMTAWAQDNKNDALREKFFNARVDELVQKLEMNDEQKENYITNLIDETYRSTIENLVKYPNDFDYTGEGNYWISNDRAMYIAENEANTVINSAEFVEAKERGCTHKIWDVFPDDRVRMTHLDVYGARIPLDAYFDVGNARLLYPKDVTSEFSTGAEHPEECVNCRCSLLYV